MGDRASPPVQANAPGDGEVPVVFVAFDVLAIAGEATFELPYSARRQRLDALALDGAHWRTPAAYLDEALFKATLELGLEGVVAKRLDEPYMPSERRWVKVKHPTYWRYDEERASLLRDLERRRARVQTI